MASVRRAEILFVGDAASIVRAAKQAEAATAQAGAAAKKSAEETAAANKTAGDSAVASATKQKVSAEKASAAMSSAGSKLSKLTIPILGAGIAAVKMGSDFQAAMERIHTQSGATQKEVNKLNGQVLALAKTSPQGPVELANALYRLEGAGYRGAKAMAALTAASKLAAVGNASVEDTTKTLTQVMKPGIKGVKDFNDAVAQINATVGSGDMRLGQLVDALGTGVVTSAKQAGLSFKDVTAALAVFGDETNNIDGWSSQFATALHFITNPTMKAGNALATIGLQSTTLAQDFQKPNGLLVGLRDLKQHLDDTFPKGTGHALTIDQERKALDQYKTTLDQAGVKGGQLTKQMDAYKQKLQEYGTAAVAQAQVLGDILPGGRGRVLSVLLNQTDLLNQKYKQNADTFNSFGASVAKTQETTANKMKVAWSTIQVDAVQVGQALAPEFLKVGQGIANEVDKIAKAFMSLPAGARQALITGGIIVAGLGPALKLMGVFTSGIGKLWQMVQLINGSKVLGGGAVGSSAASSASVAASAGAGSTSVGALRSVVSRAVGGASIAGMGVLISQTVGSAVKGGIGSAVKNIGTYGSVGAGIGSVFGPGGMLAGAMVGGMVGAVKMFIKDDAAQQGEEWAKKFTASLPGHLSKATTQGLAKATTAVGQAPKPGSQQAAALSGNIHLIMNPGQQPNAALFNKQFNKDFNELYTLAATAGKKTGDAFVKSWQSVKFPSEPMMLASMNKVLSDVPAQVKKQGDGAVHIWRDQAAKQMLEYATTLSNQGKLPIAAVARLMKGLEAQVPGFSAYLENQGLVTAQVFAKTLKFTTATNTLKTTLANYRKQFGDTSVALKVTGDNIEQNIAKAMDHLRLNTSDASSKTRKAAVAEFQKLHDQAATLFSSMGDKVQASIKSMGVAIKGGSASAAKVAGENLTNFTSNVASAMSNGVLSVGEGMQLIVVNTNKALKEMGQKQLSPIQVAQFNSRLGSKGAYSSGHGQTAATGGLFQIGSPGQAGRDSVPLNVGGMPIVVAPGEQVAVFNRHQIPDMNARLADQGGLSGYFASHKKPNYMASGGMVGGGIGAMISEANSINAKHYPYVWGGGHNASFSPNGGYDCSGAVSAVLHAAGLLSAPEVSGQLASYGLPGPGPVTIYANPEHTFMSIMGRFFGTHGSSGAGWYAGSARPGFTVRHPPVGAGGQISAPSVSGGGAIATLAKSAMKKGAAAANGLLAKIFAKMTAGGSTGGGNWGTFGSSGGPVEAQLASALRGDGFNKAAVAGILGNVAQESQYGAASKNLFQFTPAIAGSSGSVSEQVALMMGHGGSGLLAAMNAAGSPGAAATLFMNSFEKPLASAANLPNRIAQAQAAFASGYSRGGMPFVGAYKNGGIIPRTGMALVHKGEGVVPAFAMGGSLKQTGAVGSGSGPLGAVFTGPHNPLLPTIPTIPSGLLFPVDAMLTALGAQLSALQSKSNVSAKAVAAVNAEITKLTQFKTFTDAVAGLRTTVAGLASQAAQAWNQAQQTSINAAHDATIKAINNSPEAQQLAGMQAQDKASANQAQLDSLNNAITSDQFTVAHSAGQTHVDAVNQLKADQQALTDYNRQQQEQQIQDDLTASTQKADDAQTTALAGLDQQTSDYQDALGKQLDALTSNLATRKLTYAQWAKDVNNILAGYGLSVATDPSTEAAVSAGPAATPAKKKSAAAKKVVLHGAGSASLTFGGHRAMGGPVAAGLAYTVGERGQETFVPNRSGRIVPNGQGGGGANVHIEKFVSYNSRSVKAFADRLAYRASIGVA